MTTIRTIERPVNKALVELYRLRIDACDTLIDYVLDDIPHKDQKPTLDSLRSMRSDLQDEMEDAPTA